jgi:hypothetical protein
VGCRAQQHLALDQGLADQAEFVILEIAQAAMDQLAAARGRALRKVVAFAEQDRKPTARGITGDAGPVDPAAHHQDVETLHVLADQQGLSGGSPAA